MYTPQNLKIIDIFLRETVVADTLNMLHLLQQYREYREIDEYLDLRKRYGEKLNPNSFLVREQFDIRDPFAISKCQKNNC
jgi:hypothetical protein